MSLVKLSALFAFAAVLLSPSTVTARSLTYRDFLSQLVDLDRLTFLDDGVNCGIASSWDRNEWHFWGSNGDSGQYIRVDPNGEAVMLDQDGPGCIYRIWSANPQGKIRIYLDGADTPSFEWDFSKLFSGEIAPFVKPLVFQRSPQNGASDSYIPIPFAKHIKVVADQKYGQYYHLNFLTFPKDWQVPTFRLPLSADEDTALQQAAAAWSATGTDPKPQWAGQEKKAGKITIEPGKTVDLLSAVGPGEIRAIRMRVQTTARRPWRKLVLRGTWDGADWPQILTPVGPFFGFDWEQPEYTSLIAGCQKGLCYFYYPMPYRKSAHLELKSYLNAPADIEYEVESAPDPQPNADRLYFFARWRHEPKAVPFDYTFIETAGHGHLVGITQQIDHPIPGWWGEGDEKIWVDDDGFPRWIGTGSEDYYGDAWGLHQGSHPAFGADIDNSRHSCPYRWHFMDMIPFSQRLRMTIENYGPNGQAGPHEYEHNSVAFWYQQELVPPFAQLEGKTYLGSQVMGKPPSEQHYQTNRFQDLDAEALRTTGLDVPFALEAEKLLADNLPPGAHIVDDAGLPYELNDERGVDFGQVKEGQVLAELQLPAAERNVYFVKMLIAPLPDTATLRAEVGDARLAGLGRPATNVQDLGGVALAAGANRMKLVAASSGPLILDAVQMQPAGRITGAIEAEELPIVSGADIAHASAPLANASAGRVLDLQATGPDQGCAVRFDETREWPYTLAVRPMMGPTSGIIRGYVDGKPIGPAHDLYAADDHGATMLLPLGTIGKDVKDVEIRVVGKNDKSTGYHAGLDYFRFDPVILGPGTPPDVWARVVRTKGCEYKSQILGPNWYSGNQLWVAPSGDGAFIDIGLELPREGDWDLACRYTTSWDYASVQPSLDGKPLGDPQDCYTKEVALAPPTDYGKIHLTAGEHILRIQAAGHNDASKGYLMGIDYVTLKPTDN